jgi:hypothetical protein
MSTSRKRHKAKGPYNEVMTFLINFIDCKSGYIWVYLIPSNSSDLLRSSLCKANSSAGTSYDIILSIEYKENDISPPTPPYLFARFLSLDDVLFVNLYAYSKATNPATTSPLQLLRLPICCFTAAPVKVAGAVATALGGTAPTALVGGGRPPMPEFVATGGGGAATTTDVAAGGA